MSPAPAAYVEARVDQILEAAFRVFVRKGIAPARMQDIAREAGLSAGALYRYFEGKHDLTRRVFEHCEEQNRALFESARSESDSALGALLATGDIAWSWFEAEDARDHQLLNLDATLAGAREPDELGIELAAHTVQVIDELEQLVRAAQTAGQLPDDLDPRALALALFALHQGLGVLLVGLATVGHDLDCRGVFEVLARMLQALAAEGSTNDVAS